MRTLEVHWHKSVSREVLMKRAGIDGWKEILLTQELRIQDRPEGYSWPEELRLSGARRSLCLLVYSRSNQAYRTACLISSPCRGLLKMR